MVLEDDVFLGDAVRAENLRRERNKAEKRKGDASAGAVRKNPYVVAKRFGERQVPLFQAMLSRRDKSYSALEKVLRKARRKEDKFREHMESAEARWKKED